MEKGAPAGAAPVAESNEEAHEAWDGPLFDRFVEYRDLVTAGLGAHGEAALAVHPPNPGDRVLDIGCGFGDTTQRLAQLVGPNGSALGIDVAANFIEAAEREAESAGLSNVELRGRRRPGDRVRASSSTTPSRAWGRCSSPTRWPRCATSQRARVPEARFCMVVWRRKLDNEWVLPRARRWSSEYLEQARGIRRAHLRAGAVLDGRSGHHQRHPARGRLRGHRAPPLRSTDHDRRRPRSSDRLQHSRSARPGRWCGSPATTPTASGPRSRPTSGRRWPTSSSPTARSSPPPRPGSSRRRRPPRPEARRYLMKRISEYFGSGQRSSATTFSSLSAASRTLSIAGELVVAGVDRQLHALDVLRVLVGLVELLQRGDQLVDERPDLLGHRRDPGLVGQLQVAERRRQDHRLGDVLSGLGLDVGPDHVLLEHHLVARLELALREHLVLAECVDRGLRRAARATRRAWSAGSSGRGSRPRRARPRRSCPP